MNLSRDSQFTHTFPSYGAIEPNAADSSVAAKKTISENSESEEPEMLLGHKFGWGNLTPDCLQRFNTTRWLLFFIAIGNLAARLSTGALLPPSVTTLQLRFGISNTAVGVIASMNDIVSIVILPLVCFVGERYHKGRIVGWGFLLSALGLIVFTIPQWLSDPWLDTVATGEVHSGNNSSEGSRDNFYNGSLSGNNLMSQKLNSTVAAVKQSVAAAWGSVPLGLFLFGQCITSLGATPVETVGFTYIDENVTQKSSGLYLTLFQMSGIMAGVVGFLLVAGLLTLYGDFYRSPADAYNDLRGTDLWYGCWWLAYFVAAMLSFLAILPILGYPKNLPKKQLRRAKDIDLTHYTGNEINALFGSSWATYIPSLKELLRNPAFVLSTINSTIGVFVLSGFVIFMPLYFKYAFDFSEKWAAIYSALAIIFPATLGAVFGGVLLKRRQYNVRELMILYIVVLVITGLLYLFLLNYCGTPPMAGVNAYYSGKSRDWKNGVNLNDSCNADDQCDPHLFKPVCDRKTGLEYFSSCFAGCRKSDLRMDKISWKSCNCGKEIATGDSGPHQFQVGTCPRDRACFTKRVVVLIFLSIASFIQGIEIAPFDQILLRSVGFSSRILAKGMQMVIVRLFGVIPGPIVFGLALDTCCMIWKREQSQHGQCLKYSIERMTSLLLIVTETVRVVSLLLMGLALLLFKPVGEASWGEMLVAKWLRRGRIQPSHGSESDVKKSDENID